MPLMLTSSRHQRKNTTKDNKVATLHNSAGGSQSNILRVSGRKSQLAVHRRRSLGSQGPRHNWAVMETNKRNSWSSLGSQVTKGKPNSLSRTPRVSIVNHSPGKVVELAGLQPVNQALNISSPSEENVHIPDKKVNRVLKSALRGLPQKGHPAKSVNFSAVPEICWVSIEGEGKSTVQCRNIDLRYKKVEYLGNLAQQKLDEPKVDLVGTMRVLQSALNILEALKDYLKQKNDLRVADAEERAKLMREGMQEVAEQYGHPKPKRKRSTADKCQIL